MSALQAAANVKLVMSVLAAEKGRMEAIIGDLADRFGRPDTVSSRFSFEWTDYYAKEMGAPLWRRFVSFEPLIRPESLPDIKAETNELESRHLRDDRRQVNIDPGYIALAHLILATGKGFAHRPYLRRGVYADLALVYHHGTYEKLPWTYPDYASPDTVVWMNRIREKYLLQLRESPGERSGRALECGEGDIG